MITLKLLEYPDHTRGYVTDADKSFGFENLQFQIQVRGATVIKDVHIPTPEEIRVKYPRIMRLIGKTSSDPVSFIRDYLYFSPIGTLSAGFLAKIAYLKILRKCG